jgi:hypothetical protein
MSVDKKDPPKEDSESSMESSPEGEAPAAPPQQQAENQQPKRKGGRKPVRQQEIFAGRFPAPFLVCSRACQDFCLDLMIFTEFMGRAAVACTYMLIRSPDLRDI